MEMVSIVRENSLGLINVINPDEFLDKTDLNFDQFDMDNSTINDLIDYVEFSDIEYYSFIFLGEMKRLDKLVSTLNRLTEVKFSLYNIFMDCISGEKNPHINNYIEIDFSKFENTKDISSIQLENGIKALITGIYPYNLHSNIIKHLYIEKLSLFNSLSPSIIKNMAINSGVFCEDFSTTTISTSDVPFPLFDTKIIEDEIKQGNFVTISQEEFSESMNHFELEGFITKDRDLNGYIDFASLANVISLNRLFFFVDGVYLDIQKELKVANSVEVNYPELRNFISEFDTTLEKKPLVYLYPNLLSIMDSLSINNCYFITPYTNYKFPQVDKVVKFNMMGIRTEMDDFCYSLLTGKFFRVNETFLMILEADIKGLIESSVLRNLLKDNYDKLIKDYRRITSNV